jgi:CheY-like chemotaxis protein
MAKTALIVDDSASARFVLGGMLSEQALAVDTAASGEEALEYLRHSRPDVIFMDHMMPGMDGLQALEAIKDNPATATIPVMMYTSQEGELYVGQARALGAIGVLPKQVRPVEVTKVLDALHLTDDTTSASASPSETEETQDGSPVNVLLEELFKEQRAILRDELRRGYEQIAETTVTARQLELEPRPSQDRFGLVVFGLAVLAATTVSFAYLYFDSRALLEQANERIALLAESVRVNIVATNDDASQDDTGLATADALLELLQWGASQAERYSFSETALNERRAQQLTELSQRVSGLGITGLISVDVHVGRYCMNLEADGILTLPTATQLVSHCQQIGWAEADELAMGAQQTLPFANAIALASRDGAIRFDVVSHGASQPLAAYPPFNQAMTAGEWNEIAAANQRVEVRILPD